MLLGCKDWCRLCGNDIEEMREINIFKKTEYFSTISDAIQKLLSIIITSTDIIPTEFCNECTTSLYKLINFYTHCQNTQQMYNEIIHNINTENLQNNQINLNEYRIKYKLIKNPQIELSFVDDNIEIKNEDNNKLNISINNNYNNNEFSKNLNINQNKIKNIEEEQSITKSSLNNTIKSNKNINNQKYSNIFIENLYYNKNMIEKQIKNSSTSPTTTIIYCDICKKMFTSSRGYSIHLKLKHSIKKEPIVCKYCGKLFKIHALLKKHENTHLPNDKKKFYPCKKCDKKFSSDSGLWSHIHTVHDKNHSVICEECGKKFPTSSYLKSHKLSHKLENDFQCPKCPMKLKRKKTLMIHLQTHGENFICPICGIQLNTKKTLRDHMVVHSDEKKFKCNICYKNFKREKTLNSHLILHTGLKPYECEFCKKRFSHGSNFRTHQKNSHPIELAAMEDAGEKKICKELPKAKLLKEFNTNSK